MIGIVRAAAHHVLPWGMEYVGVFSTSDSSAAQLAKRCATHRFLNSAPCVHAFPGGSGSLCYNTGPGSSSGQVDVDSATGSSSSSSALSWAGKQDPGLVLLR